MTKLTGLGLFLIIVSLTAAGCYSDQPDQEYRVRTDMYTQPSYRHNEDPRPAVDGTVPTKGYMPSVKDSALAARMTNPYVFTEVTLDTARFLFETYCSVCHGPGAKGDGLVAPKFQVPPDLTTLKYMHAPDGYIYSVVRNGHLIMPGYYENTTVRERWLIVSHLRRLQKK